MYAYEIYLSRSRKSNTMEKLTRQEEDVMRRIWAIAPCFIKDVLTKYEDPKPPYTTVASVVKNLERKKYVKAKHYGNTYEYTSLISQEEYLRESMDILVKNYFGNSYKNLVAFFADNQKISAGELNEVADRIGK